MKYGNYPGCLRKLVDEGCTDIEQSSVAKDCLSLSRCCLDSFMYAFEKDFPTVREALGATAPVSLRSAFAIVWQSTDLCERQHTEVTASKPSKAQVQNVAHFARFNSTKHMDVLRRRRGGAHPMKLRATTALADSVTASVMPFLAAAMEARSPPEMSSETSAQRCRAVVPREALGTQEHGFDRAGRGRLASGGSGKSRGRRHGASRPPTAW